MRGKVKIKNKRISKIASKTILILISILTIMAFCMSGYEKSAISANIVKANENSTVDENTPKNDATNGITGDASNDQLPVTLDKNQLESLDDYISNNKQNPDSETPKEEQTTEEDGIQPDEENQEINEQNAEENSDVNAISDDATANEDEGIALFSSESKGEATVSWKSQIKGEYWNKINKIIGTSDGGAVAVGWIYQESTNPTITTNGNKDALIIKYDKDGKIEWFKNYGGSEDDEFTDVVQAEDGNFIGKGTTESTDLGFNGIDFIYVVTKDGSSMTKKNNSPKSQYHGKSKEIILHNGTVEAVEESGGVSLWYYSNGKISDIGMVPGKLGGVSVKGDDCSFNGAADNNGKRIVDCKFFW